MSGRALDASVRWFDSILQSQSGRYSQYVDVAKWEGRALQELYESVRPDRRLQLWDDYTCGYCGLRGDRATMTVDHVLPRAAGGKSSWENLVALRSLQRSQA